MPVNHPMRIDGELLRSLREKQGLDITLLSRQVNLSVAQLRELESVDIAPGERSLFYSDAIKDNAARKVALQLGADPQALTALASTGQPQPDALPRTQVLDDLAQLLEKQKQSQQVAARRTAPRSATVWLGMLLCLTGAAAWYVQKPSPPPEPSPLSEAQPAAPLVTPSVLPTQGSAPVTAPTLVPASLSLQSDALCAKNDVGATLKPSMPSKAGNMVYVVAQADTTVCVQDATGKTTAVGLKAQESRSFYGVAPWTVHFDNPGQVQLFFQGQRLRWPDSEQSTFILREVPGAY